MGRTIIDGSTIVSGSITADQIDVKNLFAAQATIGGWIIHPDQLVNPTNTVSLYSEKNEKNGNLAIAAGHKQFSITNINEILPYYKEEIDGTGYIEERSIDAYFSVTSFGYAVDGRPYLYAKGNRAGNPDLYYYQGQKLMDGEFCDYWISDQGEGGKWGTYTNIIMKNATFTLYNDGSLYASNATISGTINANDGDIGGWLIGTNCLMSQNENVK